MHFKMILATTELVLIIVGLLTFAYSIYAIYNTKATALATAGQEVVKAHQFLLYGNLVVQLLQFAVVGLLVYKV